MASDKAAEALPESELNALLRRVDWRFLLHTEEAPAVADMTAGKTSLAVRLIGAEGEPQPGMADLAAIGYPSRLALRGAVESVRPGGEVACAWRLPRPAAPRRVAARMRAAGLEDVRLLWPGPMPFGAPQFWLPLEGGAATAEMLSQRPPGSAFQAALRPLWRAVARAGLLSPLCAIGRRPGGGEIAREPSAIEAIFSPEAERLLLTGGKRSINKVVGLPYDEDGGKPAAVVKFARVASADEALDREAAALRAIEDRNPDLPGVPRLLEEGRRAGRRALVESALHGTPLIAGLTPERFEDLAGTVTHWLTELAGDAGPQEPGQWRERLVDGPLEAFERDFGRVVPTGLVAQARNALAGLGALPLVPEHRDCSPWNVVLSEGEPGLLDWESAEPRGLPGLDLAYFLANCAFVLDGALESGRTRQSYERLLDPSTPYGTIATRCEREYREALGLDPADLARLRLLAWLVHSQSDFRHTAMESGGRPRQENLRTSTYLGLVEAELQASPRP